MVQGKQKQRTTVALWGMVAILLFIGAVALSQVNADAVWFDEERTFQKINGGRYLPLRTPTEIVDYMLSYGDTWPPLYNFAFAGWGTLVGWSVYVHRVMAWFFGLLGIAATYRLGVTVAKATPYRHSVGLVAAGLLSTSAFYVYYMHEMRGYTMSVFFIIMSVWLYWRLANGSLKPNLIALFVFFNVCVLYTHYIPALMLMSIGLFHLISYQQVKPAKWWQILGLFAVSLLPFLPWVASLISILGTESTANRGLSVPTALISMLNGYGNGLWIALPILLGVAAWYVRKRAAFYLWFIAVSFIVAALIANYPLQYLFHIRHTMSLIPIVITLASLGIVTIYHQRDVSALVRLGVAATIFAWIISGVWYSFDRQLMNSLPGAEDIISADAIHLMTNVSNQCIGNDEKAVFHLVSNYSIEWINDPVLMRQFWTDSPFEYANLNKLQYVPNQYKLDRAITRYVTNEPDDYTERVRWYADNSERIWLFSLSDLPHDEKIAEFESALRQDYNTCGRVQSQAGVDVYVWSNTTTLACEPLGDISLAPCTDDIVKVSPNKTGGGS